MPSTRCNNCDYPLKEGVNFCTNCGSPVKSSTSKGRPSGLDHLIDAIRSTVNRADPQNILLGCIESLNTSRDPVHAGIASVLSMASNAKLGRFAEARDALLQARHFYASHLGLTEEQHACYVKTGYLPDEIRQLEGKDIEDSPWLYDVLGTGIHPSLPEDYRGETEEEKRRNAMQVWSNYLDNQRPLKGVLARLLFENCSYTEAVSWLERVILISRRYWGTTPVRPEVVWPCVTLGECFLALGNADKANRAWQGVRAMEICCAAKDSVDDWGRLALPWIDKAKSKLLEHGFPIPSPGMSLDASKHLRLAWDAMLEAEQFEAGATDLIEIASAVERAGRRYLEPLSRAAALIESVEQLDSAVWADCRTSDSSFWCTLDLAKSMLRLKHAIVYLSQEKLALAVAQYKDANSLWPTIPTYGVMGGLQAACGLNADARATYSKCIQYADEIGATDSSESREETLNEIRQALYQLGN